MERERNKMPTALSKKAHLNKIYPIFAITTTITTTLFFYNYIQNDEKKNQLCAKYIRTFVFAITVMDMMGAFPHWLMKPFGGLERIAGMKGLNNKTAAGVMVGVLQATDGIHRVGYGLIWLYINFVQTQFCYLSLLFKFGKSLVTSWTFTYYKPLPLLNGKNSVIEHAPGRFRYIPAVVLPALFILYTWYNGDFAKYTQIEK